MIPQPEILEHLKTIPSLRDKPCKLYSWPEAWRPDFEQHYREWARITGSFPLKWRWTNQEDADRRVELCLATDANICLHVSPDWPGKKNTDIVTVKDAVKAYKERWKQVDQWINHRVDIAVVYIDLEGYKYKLGDHERNKDVAKFNRQIYEIAKEHVGSAEVRRYNHLSVHDVPNSEYGGLMADRDTQPHDPVDGGFGVSLYNVIDKVGTHRDLTRTIEHAKRYGINRGTAWVGLGGAVTEDWLCPGTFPELDSSNRFGILPYDPEISYELGGLFGNSWFQRDVHGQSQRNGRFPNVTNCDVCFWPGPFRERFDQTLTQFLAFILGFVPTPYEEKEQIIDDLRKLQVKYWKEGRVGVHTKSITMEIAP